MRRILSIFFFKRNNTYYQMVRNDVCLNLVRLLHKCNISWRIFCTFYWKLIKISPMHCTLIIAHCTLARAPSWTTFFSMYWMIGLGAQQWHGKVAIEYYILTTEVRSRLLRFKKRKWLKNVFFVPDKWMNFIWPSCCPSSSFTIWTTDLETTATKWTSNN